MKYLKLLFFVTAFAVASSCKNDPGESENNVNTLVTQSAIVTMFTSTLHGEFGENLSNKDLSLGKTGFLVIENSQESASVLKNWESFMDNSGILTMVSYTSAKRTCSSLVDNLKPSTQYDYCLFYESEDGDSRMIGNICSFKTLDFKPDFKILNQEESDFFRAIADCSHSIDPNDLVTVELGAELFESEECVSVVVLKNSDLKKYSRFNVVFDYLRCGKDYKSRLYMKDKRTRETVYSDWVVMKTKDSDLMKVDLGLSVMWADRNIGYYKDDEIVNNHYLFAWGLLESFDRKYQDPESLFSGCLLLSKYAHWDDSKKAYIEIGSDISGTEFDVAHYFLGGKWRMPTKSEIEELEKETTHSKAILGHEQGYSFKANGKSIFMSKTYYWTSNLSGIPNEDTGLVYPWFYSFRTEFGDDCQFDYSNSFPRQVQIAVRPVWDPNME